MLEFTLESDSSKFVLFQISQISTPQFVGGGEFNLTITGQAASDDGANVPFENGNEILVSFVTNGDKGDKGDKGAQGEDGGPFLSSGEWITTLSGNTPTDGQFILNQINPSSTSLVMATIDSNGNNFENMLLAFSLGDTVTISRGVDYGIFRLNSLFSPLINTQRYQANVTHLEGNITNLFDSDGVKYKISRNGPQGPPGTNAGRGDRGEQGEIGPKGQQGERGPQRYSKVLQLMAVELCLMTVWQYSSTRSNPNSR